MIDDRWSCGVFFGHDICIVFLNEIKSTPATLEVYHRRRNNFIVDAQCVEEDQDIGKLLEDQYLHWKGRHFHRRF